MTSDRTGPLHIEPASATFRSALEAILCADLGTARRVTAAEIRAGGSGNLQYLAGFFDGEGSIGIAGESLQVRVVNSYRPILEKFQKAFGGVVAIHHKGDDKSRLTWEWRCYGDTAGAALTALLPLLREKAPQAYLGLHYRTLPKGPSRVHVRAALSLLKKTTHYQGAHA